MYLGPIWLLADDGCHAMLAHNQFGRATIGHINWQELRCSSSTLCDLKVSSSKPRILSITACQFISVQGQGMGYVVAALCNYFVRAASCRAQSLLHSFYWQRITPRHVTRMCNTGCVEYLQYLPRFFSTSVAAESDWVSEMIIHCAA